jgi:hypothetical protein
MTRFAFGPVINWPSAFGTILPRQSELVGEPAALDFLAAGGQLVPVIVDLLLGVAIDDERDRGREAVRRPAIERDERLTVELEAGGHPPSPSAGPRVAITAYRPCLGILENRRVEVHRLFRLAVETIEMG